MKIALCLSGYFRGFNICWKTWKEHLLIPDFDIFLCTGETKEWNTKENIDKELEILKNEFNVKSILFEEPIPDPKNGLFEQRNFYSRDISGFLSMLHKIKSCNSLKSSYEKENDFIYDCVIRFRPDIYLKSPMVINESQNMNSWHIPKFGDYGGLNDQIGWSSSKNMNNYSSMFDEVEGYLLANEKRTLFHEAQLLNKWKRSGCGIERHPVLYQFARAENWFEKDNETREKEDGFIK